MIDIVRAALVFALAGCGRIGFTPTETSTLTDGGMLVVPPDQIAVTVYGEPGVTVLIERSPGFDRALTDANGVVMFEATAPATIHALLPNSYIRTAIDVDPGTSVVFDHYYGGSGTPGPAMTIALPAFPGATNYVINGGSCIQASIDSAPMLSVVFRTGCVGNSTHLVALALMGEVLAGYIDLGQRVLTANSSFTVADAWATPASYTIAVSSVPSGALDLNVAMESLESDRSDSLTVDVNGAPGSSVTAGSASVMRNSLPSFNELYLYASSPTATTSMTITGPMSPGINLIDASAMLPVLGQPTLSPTFGATWPAVVAPDADLVAFRGQMSDSTSSSFITWDCFAPAGTTTASFPIFPADLAVPVPDATWLYYQAGVELLEVTGFDRRAVLGSIDNLFVDGDGFETNAPIGTVMLSEISVPL